MKHPTKSQYNYANIWYNTQEDERFLKRRICNKWTKDNMAEQDSGEESGNGCSEGRCSSQDLCWLFQQQPAYRPASRKRPVRMQMAKGADVNLTTMSHFTHPELARGPWRDIHPVWREIKLIQVKLLAKTMPLLGSRKKNVPRSAQRMRNDLSTKSQRF